METKHIGIGDRIRVRIATRSGWLTGWRVVNGFEGNRPTIRAHGWTRFVVRPCEIEDWKTRFESDFIDKCFPDVKVIVGG